MLLSKIAGGLLCGLMTVSVAITPVAAIEIAPFTSMYSKTLNGNFVMAGNTSQTCSSTLGNNADSCRDARKLSTGVPLNNDDFVMRNLRGSVAGLDTSVVFNASTSQIQMPRGSTVQKAFLFWFGNLETPSQSQFGIAPENVDANSQVLFARPDENCASTRVSKCQVKGSVFTESLGGNQDGYYTAHADVTEKLTDEAKMKWTEIGNIQSAIFTVGNVQGSQGIGTSAGWSLVVVYTHPNEEIRRVDVHAGFGFIAPRSSQFVIFNGLNLPSTGEHQSSIGVFAADGDPATTGDSVTFSSGTTSTVVGNSTNAPNNIMNSTVTQDGVPSSYLDSTNTSRSKNTFGVDVDRFDVIDAFASGSTSTRAAFTSTQDTFFLSAVVLSTPVAGADVVARKFISQVIQGGAGSPSEVSAGDVIEYSIELENVGSGSAKNVGLMDDFDAEHLTQIVTTTPGCSVTGSRLSCANLGLLNPGDPPILVKVSAKVLAGTGTISNVATAKFNSSVEVTSNVVTVAYGKYPVDLGVRIEALPDFVQAGGQSKLTVTIDNFGPAADPSPKMKFTMSAGLAIQGALPAHCNLVGRVVTCLASAFGISNASQLESGQSASIDIDVKTKQSYSRHTVTAQVFTGSLDGDPNPDNDIAQATVFANHPPTAKPALIRAQQSGPIVKLDIAPFIADRDGDSLRLSYDSILATYGIVRLSATTFTYKPTDKWNGTISFAYRVNDGRGGIAQSTIKVIVSPVQTSESQNTQNQWCRGFVRAGC